MRIPSGVKRARAAAVAAAGLLLCAPAAWTGGGGALAADAVTLQLNWFHLADHSPFYLAMERGFFEEEGIDLTVVKGSGSGDAAKKVDLKAAEFGISDTPTVLTAITKGADLTIVGMVYDKAANNTFFSKATGIERPQDLVGRSIAVPPADSHRVLWPAFAAVNGLDPDSVTLVNVKPEGKQAIVAGGQVDAAHDLYTSYPIWEKVLGEGNVGNLLWADHGVELYGHAYIVHRDLVAEKPDLVERFLRATYRGWRDARQEPEAAIEAMMKEVPGIDRDAYVAHMGYVLDLVITERSEEHGLGWIVPERMQNTIDLTARGGTLDRELKADEVFTNEFNSKVMPAS
ncbi:MAG TPA: ABC transporter substrate-binding protein [Geminicoccaceae bacterium]|nr:ABC transporter substrate-binding protein [Geminicoccaceae bacterium]